MEEGQGAVCASHGDEFEGLGPEHPSTLTSMNNFAWTFWSLDLKEAIQLMSEVFQYRQKKIGSDHPNTVQSIRILHEWRALNVC